MMKLMKGMMLMDLLIDGQSVKNYLVPGSLELTDAINEYSVAEFSLIAPKNTLNLMPGLHVELKPYTDYGYIKDEPRDKIIFDYGKITEPSQEKEDLGFITDPASIFGGTIDNIQERRISAGTGMNLYGISCVDNHFLLDRHYVVESFENKTVSYIVNFIVNKYLAEEGIKVHLIQNGDFVIKEAVFNYRTSSEVFKQIADSIGCVWYLDADKRLFIVERTIENSPWGLTETAQVNDVVVYYNRDNYRNKQFVKDGKAETDELTQTFKGDGLTKTFTLEFPVSRAPKIKLDGIPQSVGIRGLETGKDFYWNKDDKIISSEVSVPEGSIVEVKYIGIFDVVLIVKDDIEIQKRKEKEGGSGIYENVYSKKGLNTIDGLTAVALNELRKFGNFSKKITFTTRRPGLQAGQLISVNLPEHNLTGDLLIISVNYKEEGKFDNFKFFVTAITSEVVGGWTEFFREWTKKEEVRLVDEVDIVTIALNYTKVWQESDFPNIFHKLYPSENLYPSTNLYPMFHPNQEVKYISWHNIDGEYGRKTRILQTKKETEIKTTFLVYSSEAIGNIVKLGFWGGVRASENLDTGIKIDEREFVKEKTKLEIIQVIRNDIKGW